MKVPVEQLRHAEARFRSFEREETEKAKSITQQAGIETFDDNLVGSDQRLSKRKQMLLKVLKEPVDFAFERAIGNNDSVYSNFCELIAAAKQKVGRIVLKQANKNIGFATGFMVSNQLLLTNWHVLPTLAAAADSEVEFYYELDIHGRPTVPHVFKLAADTFYYSNQQLDYCFVAVESRDVTATLPLSSIGYLSLDPAQGKLGEEGKELLNIIHHPDGDYKQLSIRENKLTKILPDTVWYQSDTAQGSSGSPVFNDQWQVVALHHMGVPSTTADGRYLDKRGRVIPEVNGQIDISKIDWIANEGIRISVLLQDVQLKLPQSTFVKTLSMFAPLQTEPQTLPYTNNSEANSLPAGKNSDNMLFSFPASLLGTGQLSLTIKKDTLPATIATAGPQAFLDEVRKLDYEASYNYSACRGYQNNFLGVKVMLPKPGKRLKRFLASVKETGNVIFNYHHFSILFHSVRRMPALSAINVNADEKYRLDTSARSDVWIRDNRLSYDLQLNDAYYANSGFDRGHMSRREDANWGETAELAKAYADLTCVYTNACPQVPELNRLNRYGLWGKLETLILENGAAKETGKASKITVFNGPIFNDNDPVYKGVQIPLDFWKVIVWFNAGGQLRATGFKLSQVNLVDDINFEELQFDANLAFQPYQVSLQGLEKLTGLQFGELHNIDTFKPNKELQHNKIDTEAELKLLLAVA